MTGVEILQAVIEILVRRNFTVLRLALVHGLSTLATSVFLTGTGEAQTLSTFRCFSNRFCTASGLAVRTFKVCC